MKRPLTWKERWNLFWKKEAPQPEYEILERNDGICTVMKHYYFMAAYGYIENHQYLGETSSLSEAQKLVDLAKSKDHGSRLKQVHLV